MNSEDKYLWGRIVAALPKHLRPEADQLRERYDRLWRLSLAVQRVVRDQERERDAR